MDWAGNNFHWLEFQRRLRMPILQRLAKLGETEIQPGNKNHMRELETRRLRHARQIRFGIRRRQFGIFAVRWQPWFRRLRNRRSRNWIRRRREPEFSFKVTSICLQNLPPHSAESASENGWSQYRYSGSWWRNQSSGGQQHDNGAFLYVHASVHFQNAMGN